MIVLIFFLNKIADKFKLIYLSIIIISLSSYNACLMLFPREKTRFKYKPNKILHAFPKEKNRILYKANKILLTFPKGKNKNFI